MFEHKPCEWWGWWLRYPLDNLRRVWRNATQRWLG